MRHAIKAWLKAGVMDGVEFNPTETGTPQGGVISPLLANIALHGLEEAVKEGYLKSRNAEKPALIRYADDFVILHSKKEAIEKAATVVENWLKDMGLFLNIKKTKITHTYEPYAHGMRNEIHLPGEVAQDHPLLTLPFLQGGQISMIPLASKRRNRNGW